MGAFGSTTPRFYNLNFGESKRNMVIRIHVGDSNVSNDLWCETFASAVNL
jgi:hypothetical protein